MELMAYFALLHGIGVNVPAFDTVQSHNMHQKMMFSSCCFEQRYFWHRCGNTSFHHTGCNRCPNYCCLFQIAALWENSFCLPDPITAEKMDALESKFVSTARHQVKFGPNSVSDFTRWRVSLECFSTCFWLLSVTFNNFFFVSFGSQVGILAKEYLLSLTGPKKEVDSAETTGTQNNSVSQCVC